MMTTTCKWLPVVDDDEVVGSGKCARTLLELDVLDAQLGLEHLRGSLHRLLYLYLVGHSACEGCMGYAISYYVGYFVVTL